MKSLIIAGVVFCALHLLSGANGEKLVIVMLDGFRWDYISRMAEGEMPNMQSIIDDGVEVEYVQPIFPSNSFPSWTTIGTGLYAESHGIVGNYMLDEATGLEFSLSKVNLEGDTTADPIWWTKHVPLWTSATEAGIRTSLYQWSRCDVPFNDGILPEKCIQYDNADTLNITLFEEYIDRGIEDLTSGFDLVFLYYCNVDVVGHIFGPDSQRLHSELMRVDQSFGRLMQGLEEAGLKGQTNVIITADHGMTSVSDKTFLSLSQFTDPEYFNRVVERGALSFISLKDKQLADQVVQDLAAWDGVDAFKREDIPEYLHIKEDERVLDVLVVTKGMELVGWDGLANANDYLPTGTPNTNLGNHGWDDTSLDGQGYLEGSYEDMRSIFIGNGPNFKQGLKHQWIKLVDQYQIFTHLIGIEGQPHNGTWERVEGMFNEVKHF